MPLVSIRINNRVYEMACGEGEEAHIQSLAADVENRVAGLRLTMNGAAEIKVLVAAALMLADEVRESRRNAGVAVVPPAAGREPVAAVDSADKLAGLFEDLVTARVDTIAAKLTAA